ncbi:hypothetical protein TWF569_009183 [Orbilia oligospora]|nr:hypothetical protein TWF706_001715 [Orbilia oligospora]KAF3127880.1 hypothetical protein TWF594_000543 [Orbilia oligospora]KAF3137482.1 hypothetical protein TWF569_009183 [Orbilia oligospora]
MRASIPASNRMRSFLLLLSLLHSPLTLCQATTPIITTSTIFSTVPNPKTIVITLNCPTNPLPRCESLRWGPVSSTSISTTTIAPPNPMTRFVLHALEDGEHVYSLFDDENTQSFLLGPLDAPGTRLATLMLTADGRLINAEDSSEVIFVRPNITTSLIRLFPKIKRRQNIGFKYGIVLYSNKTRTSSSDIQSTFLFSDTNVLMLQYGDIQYQSYKERQNDDRGVFNLYMGQQRDDTNSIPTSLETVNLDGIDVTDVMTSSITETRASSPSTEPNPNSGATTTATGDTTLTSGSAARQTSGKTRLTSTTQTASLIANPSSTSPSTQRSDESSSSSTLREPITLVNEAYDIITSLGYQWYCSSILDSATTSDQTSTTKSGIETDVSTILQASTTFYQPPTDTQYTIFSFSSGIAVTASTVQNTVPNTGWRKGMKFIRAEREVGTLRLRTPILPASLSSFEAGVITEACGKAITPITKTKTSHIIVTRPESTSLSIEHTISIAGTITGIPLTTTKKFLEPLPTSTQTVPGAGKVFMKDMKPVYGYKDLRDPTSRLHLVAINQNTQPTDPLLQAYTEWTIRYNISDQYYYLGRRPASYGSLIWTYKRNSTVLGDYAVQLNFYNYVIGRAEDQSGIIKEYDVLYINYESSSTASENERYSWTPDISKGMPANGKFYSCQFRDVNDVIHSFVDSRALYYVNLDRISDSQFRGLVDGAGLDGSQCIVSTDNKFQFYSPTLQTFARRHMFADF